MELMILIHKKNWLMKKKHWGFTSPDIHCINIAKPLIHLLLQSNRSTAHGTAKKSLLVESWVTSNRSEREKGDFMAYVELEDLTGMIETIIFPELYKNNMMFIEEEAELVVKGRLDLKEDSMNMIASDIIL